jgi:hypothetical protein
MKVNILMNAGIKLYRYSIIKCRGGEKYAVGKVWITRVRNHNASCKSVFTFLQTGIQLTWLEASGPL